MNQTKPLHRQHPIVIFRYAKKNIWLLVFPLLRGVQTLRLDWATLQDWIRGAWFDVLIILVILLFGFLRWLFQRFSIGDDRVYIQSGMLLRTYSELPFTSVCAATMEKRFFLRPISAAWLFLDTNAGFGKSNDFALLMRLRDCQALFSALKGNETGLRFSFRPSQRAMLFFSFVFSSSLSGVVFAATLFSQAAKLTTSNLTETTHALSVAVQKIAPNISPVALAISAILLGGWLVSFVSNVMRYCSFEIKREHDRIAVKSGILTIRRHYINPAKVNYADIQQNFLTKIFHLMSVRVSCSGYGTNRSEMPVFVPLSYKQRNLRCLTLLLPDYLPGDISIRPRRRTLPRYVMPTITLALAFFFAYRTALYFFPRWSELAQFCVIMAEIPCAWHLLVRLMTFFTAGIGESDGLITLRACHIFSFHTILIKREKISKLVVRQNLFQKISKTCDVVVYTNAEFTTSYGIKGMPIEKVRRFFGIELNKKK